ncbi:hypothetical protein CXB51_025552 [Gossypium anomalum]|uniref:thioredoxin-dependent peroxiredoxin n=1 Tax=Gossypium anomalum TaxID=47600 RepID=A0A8J5YE39_9ROSI|nr:hypothetical protein CXB51_025552 [Gossypium anomalum]
MQQPLTFYKYSFLLLPLSTPTVAAVVILSKIEKCQASPLETQCPTLKLKPPTGHSSFMTTSTMGGPSFSLILVTAPIYASSFYFCICLEISFINLWVFFLHAADFTPVCTTELGKMAAYLPEFEKRGVKLLGFSCDDVQSHKEWIKDVEAYTIKLSFLYPATTGRNMDEVMRAVDSLQKTSQYKVATPANWKQGEPVVISPSVPNEEAKKMFPRGFETKNLPSGKDYLRFTNV